MTNLASGFQDTLKLNPCDFLTSRPDTGKIILNYPDMITNVKNLANEKYFNQSSIHSQTNIKNENNEDLNRSNDYPLANSINGEKLNPPHSSVDGEILRLKNHNNPTNQGTNTHPPTDSVKGERLNLNSYDPLISKPSDHLPTKSITGPSSCKAPNGIDTLNGHGCYL